MRVLRLSGDHYAMGRQHAAQAAASREGLVEVVDARLAGWSRPQRTLAAAYAEGVRMHGASTARMLDGIADGFGMERERLWAYTGSGWVAERMGRGGASLAGEGCTVWAAAGHVTRGGGPLLAKNRDYYRDHQQLQVLCDGTPARGYRWLAVGSVGSPGVFSSGMNERGLAVADTHVATRELRPGAPRYAQMLELLERCANVAEALRLLAAIPAAGGGNLVLADEAGRLAVCELSCGKLVTLTHPESVVATNHFTSLEMRRRHVRVGGVHAASLARRAVVRASLRAGSRADADAAEAILGRHGAGGAAVCRHSYPSRSGRYGTISSVIYLPREREARIADGWPCRRSFVRLLPVRDFWRSTSRRVAAWT